MLSIQEKLEQAENQMIDLVYAQRLQEASFAKKDYMNHIKSYMKFLKESIKPEDQKAFETEAQAFVKSMLGKFDELCLYVCFSQSLFNPFQFQLHWGKHGLREGNGLALPVF